MLASNIIEFCTCYDPQLVALWFHKRVGKWNLNCISCAGPTSFSYVCFATIKTEENVVDPSQEMHFQFYFPIVLCNQTTP